MLFNTSSFLIFFAIFFHIYWRIGQRKLSYQNLFLLFASYLFYSFWDFRFLLILIFSTGLDFFTGLKISQSNSISVKRKWLWLSISINLGVLLFFKYFNFFAQTFSDLLSNVGFKVDTLTLNIILPVGVSFYTFHGLSYVIDIYRDKNRLEKNFVNYAVFVSYFPLLVAGPIERANHLLPQIKKTRVFDSSRAVDALRQILWGYFKKMVIADNCAEFANQIFNNHEIYSGSTIFLGVFFFSFQIYGDFSGYSDIAQGISRLLGIELLKNFSYPYFSRDIAEFWRRWHISLSSWFKDYVYIPLGGNRRGRFTSIINVFIIFVLSGFWHGANFTFIFWGLLNALYFIPLMIVGSHKKNLDSVPSGNIKTMSIDIMKISITFLLVMFGWIFFRSQNFTQAFDMINELFSKSFFETPKFENRSKALKAVIFILLLIFVEWKGKSNNHGLECFGLTWKPIWRLGFYYLLTVIILLYSAHIESFIYFKF